MPVHQFTDILAYGIGFRLYLWFRKRAGRDELSSEQKGVLFLGAVFGALLGSKLVAWAESPMMTWILRDDPAVWMGGKSIVGGLLGGWIGIEIAKRTARITESTGDLFVFPLMLGMGIGRIGCFLTGLTDQTCGSRTSLPWGVDFGDGVPRHPTQIYEIIFLLLLAMMLWKIKGLLRTHGVLFRLFMIAYLAFRLLIDGIKPCEVTFLGMSPIQWICLIALPFCVLSLIRLTLHKAHGRQTLPLP